MFKIKSLISVIIVLLLSFSFQSVKALNVHTEREYAQVLRSKAFHGGKMVWKMKKVEELKVAENLVSTKAVDTEDWLPAIVPGTVLSSLVYNEQFAEPYYGLNNKISSNLIPDIAEVGREYYTYWFRTEFDLEPEAYANKKTWMQVDGINYRAEIWLNGNMVGNLAGMFYQDYIDITDYIKLGEKNILAIKVYPLDNPGGIRKDSSKSWGAVGEFRNGGNGEIGRNVSMLMTVGWDFTFLDGIRDRNTGIWKDISIFTTGRMTLRHPFVKSALSDNYTKSDQTISVEVRNPNFLWDTDKALVVGEIVGEGITFQKEVELRREEMTELVFSSKEFPQLTIDHPRLWWPINKGKPELYELKLKVIYNNNVTDSLTTRFGIREIISDQNTPDLSRTFYVNGHPTFVRGTNWLPENMLRQTDDRTYAELRYTAQAGINLIRFWGGGITESDYFFQLCDELGIMVWTEFWMTGDTKHPYDEGLYYKNVASTIKRIRNHPSLVYYVSSNESTEMPQTKSLINCLDGTRGYQMQSEVDGIHDGSPYKQVNIMTHYENTASDRGSRVDGFNPEYGAPCLPTVECLREMMDEKDLWPINKEVWDYSDGGGFHLMTSLYTDMTNEYGVSENIDEFAEKAQFVGAFNFRSIWEVWNYNKLHYGDRYASGVLFWYHNSPIRQVCARMWDWSLEPTAALYYTQNALEPLHPQFDFLKNTVSVNNDYLIPFSNYKLVAEVYDIKTRKILEHSSSVNIPANGVANDVFSIKFPSNISDVHFIKLRLLDENSKDVAQSFYWRSTNEYKGRTSITGPTTAGFQSIKDLTQTSIKVRHKSSSEGNKHFIDVELENTGKGLAFFTQLKWLDANLKPIRPSFYTDNFVCLLPKEKKKIRIETDRRFLTEGNCQLVVRGFNTDTQVFKINVKE